MKKIILFTFLAISFSTFTVVAQNDEHRFDIRFGVGHTLFTTGDIRNVSFDTELNYRINSYLTTSTSVGYGKGYDGTLLIPSYLQGNLNLFVSPLKNTGNNDFRIGTGVSVLNITGVHKSITALLFEDGLPREVYIYEERTSVGGNIMLENTYTINDKYLIGAKVFTQLYAEGHNLGILIKFGVRI